MFTSDEKLQGTEKDTEESSIHTDQLDTAANDVFEALMIMTFLDIKSI